MPPPAPHPLPAELLHDLRTPLNHIIGYTEMLIEQAEAAGQDPALPYLSKVRAAGYHLLTLMNENLCSADDLDGAADHPCTVDERTTSAEVIPIDEPGLESH